MPDGPSRNGTLRFDRVTKLFARNSGRRLLRERIVELFVPSRRGRFEVLHDVTFTLQPGESLGLIGANGAGKSTLLNLATGLLLPDAGLIEVSGRVGALLELGAGFHEDLTGLENLRIGAALMGLSRSETAAKLDAIIDFSGLRDFILQPLRTYSSGMRLRLGFAVAVSAEPDVLIMDEIIGVGDQNFREKALERILEFQRAGKTILLASHSPELLLSLCDQALWLDHGKVVMRGNSKEVMAAYQQHPGSQGDKGGSRR